jgi:phenylalanyl-tRNA synthetase beta chain
MPRYPASSRDVSLLVAGDLLAGDVIEAIEALSEPLVESVEVFDEYVGEGIPLGRRALAFRIVYRSSDRTLTDDEVTERHERVLAALVERLDVALRT